MFIFNEADDDTEPSVSFTKGEEEANIYHIYAKERYQITNIFSPVG